MTPADLRTALARLGLSQVEAAAHMRVDARSVRRWLAGDRPIPGLVEALLEAWERHPPAR